jgi:hypothetical protein
MTIPPLAGVLSVWGSGGWLSLVGLRMVVDKFLREGGRCLGDHGTYYGLVDL